MHHVYARAHEGHKRTPDPLELELQVHVSYHVSVARAVTVLNCEISLHPPIIYHIFETDSLTRTLPIMLAWLAGEPWRSNFLHLPSAEITEIHPPGPASHMNAGIQTLEFLLARQSFRLTHPSSSLVHHFLHSLGWFFT